MFSLDMCFWDTLTDNKKCSVKSLHFLTKLVLFFFWFCRKGIRIKEMLSEIRTALRKCKDSTEPFESSVRP